MYGLEYSSFIIDLGFGLICTQLALLHYFQIGKSCEKSTGLIGLIWGIYFLYFKYVLCMI